MMKVLRRVETRSSAAGGEMSPAYPRRLPNTTPSSGGACACVPNQQSSCLQGLTWQLYCEIASTRCGTLSLPLT